MLPFKILFDGRFAAQVAQLQSTPALPSRATDARTPAPLSKDEAAPAVPAVTSVEPEVDTTSALQLLAILQREGRFIDFVQEDMVGFGDAEIGAAARVVQEGCKRALAAYVDVASVRTESEGTQVLLESGYDAQATRVTGNVSGQPPYRGVLAHHGWRVTRIVLPVLSASHDSRIVAPAEVEVGE